MFCLLCSDLSKRILRDPKKYVEESFLLLYASLAEDNDEIKQIIAAENLEQEVKVDVYTFRNYQ